MVENSFIKKLKSSGRSLVVFYGSQTGTAEGLFVNKKILNCKFRK